LIADLGSRALSIVALWVLVDRAWGKVMDALEFGDTTNMLGLPIWPFYGLVALGMAFCILIFAVQMLTIVAQGYAMGDRVDD
jgi:TRAP-type C4-dicarboxylate transport system permease small subunit